MAPLTFSLKKGGEEVRAAAFCYVPDVVSKVMSLLDENDKLCKPPIKVKVVAFLFSLGYIATS